MLKLINAAKPFVYSALAISSGISLYLFYKSYKNKLKYESSLNDDAAKDMTRIGYEYYGINWGYKADFMIKEKIDTGDIFFLKYECNECITFKSIMTCYGKEIIQNDYEYDTFGFAYRDRDGVHVIFNFFNEIIKMDYAEFLSQPYFKEISLRRLQINENSKDLTKLVFRNSKTLVEKIGKDQNYKKMTPNVFLNEYLQSLGLKASSIKDSEFEIAEIDQTHPYILDSQFKLDNKIIIRSKPNSALVA